MFLSITSSFALEDQTLLKNEDVEINTQETIIPFKENENNIINRNKTERTIYDMNNPYQNNTERKDKISIYDMNNPYQNNTRSNKKITYFSNVLTNIMQGTKFNIILKTPNYDLNNNIINTDGTPLSNKNVVLSINNVNYTRTTDSNGIASLNINLNSGQYDIKYKFNGDTLYNSASSEIKINVFNGNTYMLYLENEIYRTEQFKVALFDANENRLSNKNIQISVNGATYTRTTDSNGIASLNMNLNPGQYTINYNFAGSGSYQSCSGSITITLSMKNLIINPINLNLKTGTALKAKVSDEDGNPVRNQIIRFRINNVDYDRTTNSSGIAALNINFNQGTYPVDIKFLTTSINMYNTVIPNTYTLNVFQTNNNLYHLESLGNYIIQGNKYKIRLTDSNNNVLANKNVYFCINAVQYTRQTDANGIASITINLNYNNYIITTSYGTSTTQISTYEMITVTSGTMNMPYSSTSDYAKNSYITTHSSYQCLNNNYIQTLANTITNGITNELEKAVSIHNYVYRLNYKYNINGLNDAYNTALLNKANCYDQTNLLMALSKSSGLAVRGVTAVSLFNINIGHAWAQFLINDKWIVSDPTNTDKLSSWSNNYNGDYYQYYEYWRAFDKEIYMIQ